MNSAKHKLSQNFTAFFKRINPSPTYEETAASAHSQITDLIEDVDGPAGDLRINCFLQGSYKRDTAIHTINDVDVVALCSLSHTPLANQKTRDQIFKMITDAITSNETYRDKVQYRKRSVCIKVIPKGIKIEVLPALRMRGKPYEYEPFYIFHPNEDESIDGYWQQSFARQHQRLITQKNSDTNGNLIPIIKALKHLRFIDNHLADEDAVSFRLECLLYALKNSIYNGSMCECIEMVLQSIAGFMPAKAQESRLTSPCRDKKLFHQEEWDISAYTRFHNVVVRWYEIAQNANREHDKEKAISLWKDLLGENYFPRNPK